MAELSELEYLRQIELLAREVTQGAAQEGWLSFEPDADASPLRRAVNEVARQLRGWHFEGDACDGEVLRLAGAALVSPEVFSAYERLCALLGVPARPEGWSLWFTWDDAGGAHTMVTSAAGTTRALLQAWSQGRGVDPARPARSQIAAVVRGWVGPMTRSPGDAAGRGLGGR